MKLTGHDILRLEDKDSGYLINQGSLALYLVRLSNGEMVGQRHYVMTCHTGSLIWGGTYPLEDADFTMVAEPVEDAELQDVSKKTLVSSKSPKYMEALESWCEKIGSFISKLQVQDYYEKTEQLDELEYSDGQKFRPKNAGFYRLVLESGKITFDKEKILPVGAEDGNLIFYATNALHFIAVEDLKGRFEQVEKLKSADLDGLLSLQSAMVALYYHRILDQERAERNRFKRLQKEIERNKRDAVDNLKLEDKSVWQPQEHDNDLQTVLEVVGHFSKLDFNLDIPVDQNLSVDGQIERICRDSGVRMRHVRLIGEWWKDDVGNILCFDKKTGKPMALLNLAQYGGLVRRYFFFDPEAREMIPLDLDMDLELNEEAYYFIRPMPTDKEEATSFMKLARFTYKPFTTDFMLMFALSFLSGLLGLFTPIANRLLVDQVIPDANKDLMVDLAIGMSCMSLGLFFFSLSQGIISLRIQTAMTAQLQSMIMDRLLKLPTRFYRNYSSGDLLNRSMMISEISAGFSGTVINAGFSLLSVLMMLLMCFYYSSKLAFLALIAAVLTSIISVSFSFVIRKIALKQERASGHLFGFMVQMVKGISKLQIAGAEPRAFAQWSKRYGQQLKDNYKVAQLQQYSSMINTFIQTFSTIALYYFAGTMIKESIDLRELDPLAPSLLTVGSFFAIQGAFSAVVGGVVNFFSSFITIHQQMAKRELARPILEAEIESGSGKKTPPPLEGLIELSHVKFRYSEDTPVILDDVSLRILPGEFIAVVGQSGCGKSTMFKLLLGFETPESGQILYDRNDTAKLDMVGIRRQIGVVLQESSVSAGTIYHNIIGASKMSMDEAWEAAEDAGLADDIKGFPMGLHTVVPEGGGTLSGGQKQRLMIARALAQNPSIVFFDEATSALDNKTQKIVTESLRRRKVTRVVIAHRLSTILDADKIIVLGEGKILEQGNYEELMKLDGMFASMAKKQTVTEET
ncbi:NHLP bacteriocin export ABC transporter permease/ATPase subunit [Curvivirga aplysinae]|uniref:NHLP bacteriocin export ABC transporter permease/ATPase subunit n=1 Tax=Curvivirga aplysinae TaxID=2529852 RepID=UPI0012BCF83D|nr:NHLP bacteriocin export ABC transporter permease/ATPase subunit [Curvivirga aplysinae]MTI10403.1 NHLP bacteriocin export ABC transporter permease/ATPase subunit [Curvivirga aplysinae]